jgi:hypothetical protein
MEIKDYFQPYCLLMRSQYSASNHCCVEEEYIKMALEEQVSDLKIGNIT